MPKAKLLLAIGNIRVFKLVRPKDSLRPAEGVQPDPPEPGEPSNAELEAWLDMVNDERKQRGWWDVNKKRS